MPAKIKTIDCDIQKPLGYNWRRMFQEMPIALIASILIATVLHFPLSVFPIGRDQGVWATAGLAINSGKVFYKDFLHFNLPGLGYSYALIFRFVDDPQVATMLLSLFGCVLILIGMFLLMRQTVNQSAASYSVLLFSIMWPTYVDFWDIAQKDFMATYGILLGTWLMARSSPEAKFRSLSIFLAGSAIAVSTMYKPLFAIAGLFTSSLHITNYIWPSENQVTRLNRSTLLKDLMLHLMGALVIVTALMLYLLKHNALQGLQNGLLIFAPAYSSMYVISFEKQLIQLFKKTNFLNATIDLPALLHFYIWMSVVVYGLIKLIAFSCKKRAALWLFIPFATALFTYFIQAKAFSYHAAPWQICLFMAAGFYLNTVKCNVANKFLHNKVAIIITLAVCFVLFRALFMTDYARAEVPAWLNVMSRHEYLNNRYPRINPESGIPSPAASEQLGAWLRQSSQPEDKILVWGLECQIYALAKRMYATHSPFDFILTVDLNNNRAILWQKQMQQQFISQLVNEKPKYIVIVNHDTNPLEPVPSNESVDKIPGFREIISNHYQHALKIEPFDIYHKTH